MTVLSMFSQVNYIHTLKAKPIKYADSLYLCFLAVTACMALYIMYDSCRFWKINNLVMHEINRIIHFTELPKQFLLK